MLFTGEKARKSAQSFQAPGGMSLEQIEAEVRALVDHEKKLKQRGSCTRLRCDGTPHVGFPYPHPPTIPRPQNPLGEAQSIDEGYSERAHLSYLSDRLAAAVKDVEAGKTRFVTVSMPPRMGKSQMISVYTPLWLLHLHPEWKIGLISHSPTLAASWGRQIRRVVEDKGQQLGVQIAHDAGAVTDWETTRGGSVISRSAPGQSITGKGFKVMIVDDPVKNFADAHSYSSREAIWEWWKSDAFTRLERPALVIVVGTRWHQDDFIGRLLSSEHEGNPDDWEVISFPAIAEKNDVLGRAPGQPLYSPIVDGETEQKTIEEWEQIHRSVGSYAWSALYQQRPSPPEGAVFSTNWWRYWTTDPALADYLPDGTPDPNGKTVLVDPDDWEDGQWVDSWDCAFKGSDTSDFVVGQRWVRKGANRYLVAQQRNRWTFSETLAGMRKWARDDDPVASPYGQLVHRRLIEAAANGDAIIDTLKDEISGIKPISPNGSKEARAQSISPEIESGNVLLPHPGQTGFRWVTDFVEEVREFPNSAHDDQVDSMTQALSDLRSKSTTMMHAPRRGLGGRGGRTGQPVSSLGSARRGGMR